MVCSEKPQASNRFNVWSIIAAVFVYSILACGLWWSHPEPTSCLDIDSTGYDRLAIHFAQTGTLVDPVCPEKAPVQTVGYPFLVGLLYRLCGHSYAIVIVWQMVIMMLAMLLLYHMVYRLWGPLVAHTVLWLSVLNVGFLVYPQFLLAETVLVFLLVLYLDRFFAFYQHGSLYNLALAAGALGCSLLIKPAALLFGLYAVALLLYRALSNTKQWFAVLLFFCLSVSPVMWYMQRNKTLYGFFHLAPMMSLNMYFVFLAKVIAAHEQISLQDAEQKIPPFQAENTLDERGWSGARELFIYYITSQPGLCLYVWLQNVAKSTCGLFSTQLKMLLNPSLKGGDVSFFRASGSGIQRFVNYIRAGSLSRSVEFIAWYEAFASLIRWCMVVLALFMLWRRRDYFILMFFIVFIINGLVITGFDGCGRYRIVIEPVLLMLTAYALVTIWQWVRQIRTAQKEIVV